MELKNKQSTQAVIARLQSVYDYMLKKPEQELAEFNKTFALIVDDIDPALVMAAAIKWIASDNAFHPKPGELRKLAIEIGAQASNKPALPDGAQAWLEAQKYAAEIMKRRNYGHGYCEVVGGEVREIPMPEFNPAVVEAARAIGVDRIHGCDVTDDMALGTLMAQFRDIYATIRNRAEKAAEVTHPLISATIAQVAARLRAPNTEAHSNGAITGIPSVQALQPANGTGRTL